CIFGRNLDKELVEQIEETTKVNIKLFLEDTINQSPQLSKFFKLVSTTKSGHYSIPISNNLLEGYTVIKDIYEKPIGMFRMTTPRAIYLTGLQAINYYLTSFLILGIIFSLLMIWLLRKVIIKRLERLDREVADISEKNAIQQRVHASG